MEIWKTIEGHPNYMVSNLGNVKHIECLIQYKHPTTGVIYNRKKKESLVKPRKTRGYNCVTLNEKNKRVCRLVAIAFIDNPDNKAEVNHIDGIKSNDNVNNLEWVTKSENMKHAFKMGFMDNGIKKRRLLFSRKVLCLRTNIVFDSINQFASARGIDSSNISRALSGVYRNNHDVMYYDEKA
jgi:hypothetical protein